jgi:hypothetical protein
LRLSLWVSNPRIAPDYIGGPCPPDNSPWRIEFDAKSGDIETYYVNPRFLIPQYCFSMLSLWRMCTVVSDMGRVQFAMLPDVGGVADQVAIMMDCLQWITYWNSEIVEYTSKIS